MFKTSGVYFILIFCIFFSACQKEILVSQNDYKTLGTSAQDLLSNQKFSSLNIEVSYMPGFAPDEKCLNELVLFLNNLLHKPNGILVTTKEVKSTGIESNSIAELVQIEKRNRSIFSLGRSMSVHVLITDAKFNEDETLLGISYWNTSFCLFGKNIEEVSGGPSQITRSQLYSILLQHEFGHLLGLVGQGSPMQQDHHDINNGAHCDNSTCLMYYGIETADNLSGNSVIPKLDAHCIADLKANGGK